MLLKTQPCFVLLSFFLFSFFDKSVVMQCLIWFFVLFEFRKQKFCLQYLVFKNVGKETKQEVNKFSSAAQTSSVIQATSVKAQHDKINMNQDSKTNNITKAQNITQTITNTDVPPTSKKNTKTNAIFNMKLILSVKNLQNRTNK